MNAYDGCHVTIEVPHSFQLDEEKSLRRYFEHDLPSMGVRVEYRHDADKARPSELSIDPHAYVRTAKTAKEWTDFSEGSQLDDDPFPIVAQGVFRTFNRFKRNAPLES